MKPKKPDRSIDLDLVRQKFEDLLSVKGLDYEWIGKRYKTVNIQTKWRYYSMGYLANNKD
jgi:hypothetical protein